MEKDTNAIDLVRQMVTDGQVSQKVAERYFPELKESEGEKIKKEIIALLKYKYEKFPKAPRYSNVPKWIDWLEKQGEQMPPEYTLEQAAGIFLDALSNTPYNNKPITDAQVITKELLKFLEDTSSYNPNAINEQKPAWSEEDEAMIAYLLQLIQNSHKEPCTKGLIAFGAEAWLKSLKDRVQPKQEWSDDDEKRMNHIIQFLEDKDRWKDSERAFPIEEDIRWLKDLKPQNRWKPSDEQMETLKYACGGNYVDLGVLESLYQDLKKLMKE